MLLDRATFDANEHELAVAALEGSALSIEREVRAELVDSIATFHDALADSDFAPADALESDARIAQRGILRGWSHAEMDARKQKRDRARKALDALHALYRTADCRGLTTGEIAIRTYVHQVVGEWIEAEVERRVEQCA